MTDFSPRPQARHQRGERDHLREQPAIPPRKFRPGDPEAAGPSWAELIVAEPALADLEAAAVEAARFGCWGWPSWLRSHGLPRLNLSPEAHHVALDHLLESFRRANPGLGRAACARAG